MYGAELNDLSDYVFIEPSKSLYYKDCIDDCKTRKCLNISKTVIIKRATYSNKFRIS